MLVHLIKRIRGQVEGGGFTVTPRHWWSRGERRSARLAAAVLEHQRENIQSRSRASILDAALYGDSLWKVDEL